MIDSLEQEGYDVHEQLNDDLRAVIALLSGMDNVRLVRTIQGRCRFNSL